MMWGSLFKLPIRFQRIEPAESRLRPKL